MDLYRRRRIDAQIDMTPMIDTLLQLFMIFLLSASLVASSVQLNLPAAAADQKNPTKPLVVAINAKGELFLNDVPVERQALRSRLGGVLENLDQKSVLLRADRTLVYQQVLDVLVEVRSSGASQVLLAYEGGKKPQSIPETSVKTVPKP
jgi:biopolymer transport protein TolR